MNIKYNESQIKAIRHFQGPCLTIAGPGSGKTATITQRINYLINECGVLPQNILVITFTKSAANEMKERFLKLQNEIGNKVTFGTFHGVFFAILKHAYNLNSSNVVSESEKRNIIKDILCKEDYETDENGDVVNAACREISLVKNERINLKDYYPINFPAEIFEKVFIEYNNKLKRRRLIDFDDMIMDCYRLFKNHPDYLEIWRNKFKYILIDEFQDINIVQYDIVKMLAAPLNNLFVVGDDDQSIYGFRGSKPQIMMEFGKDFKNHKKILLDVNYRSNPEIVNFAKKLINNNSNRFKKNISPYKQKGSKPEIKIFSNQMEENKYIVKLIQKGRANGESYKDYGIIYRTNTQPRALIGKLMENNIPFKIKDSVPNIFNHWVAKNIIAYINIARGSRDRADFLQIINRPNRYIKRECLDNKFITFDDMREYYSDKTWMCDRLDKLEEDLEIVAGLSPYAAINYIAKGIEYESYLKEYAKEKSLNEQELLDLLKEIQESAKEYSSFSEWFDYIDEYDERLKIKEKNLEEPMGVSLLTMHGAKGLEFKNVIIIDAIEGVIPHSKAILDSSIEEERRLFYVALTRAKENLHVFCIKERYNRSADISIFVKELI